MENKIRTQNQIYTTMTKLSKNFTLEELYKSETATKHNISNVPNDIEELRLKALAVNLLQPLRDKFGIISITSGYRNKDVNKLVGGVHTSYHVKGYAADCVFKQADINEVWEYIKENMKYTEAIKYSHKNMIHLAYKGTELKMKTINK